MFKKKNSTFLELQKLNQNLELEQKLQYITRNLQRFDQSKIKGLYHGIAIAIPIFTEVVIVVAVAIVIAMSSTTSSCNQAQDDYNRELERFNELLDKVNNRNEDGENDQDNDDPDDDDDQDNKDPTSGCVPHDLWMPIFNNLLLIQNRLRYTI